MCAFTLPDFGPPPRRSLRLYNSDVRGIGNDYWWPPSVTTREHAPSATLHLHAHSCSTLLVLSLPRCRLYVSGHAPTVEEVVGPHKLTVGCGIGEGGQSGLWGGPLTSDPWSGWLTSYYGGANLSNVRNIVWSNGLLDPWSGGGVYPPGGGIDGPMIQNISADGSQIALLIADGAHHLDLFFSNDEADPPSVREARLVEERMILRWAQEWRQEHSD